MSAALARILHGVFLAVASGHGQAINVARGSAGGYVDCSWSAIHLRTYNHLKSPEKREDFLKNWPCKETPDFSPLNSKKTIACIGDSITHGSHVERAETYPALLHHLLKEQYNVINLGVSGATAQINSDNSYWGLKHWNVSLNVNFDVAIVQLGSNDAKLMNWDWSGYVHDYLKMLEELGKKHPQATVLVSVPPPAYNNSFSIQPDVVGNQLRAAIQQVSSGARLVSAPIDMQRAFADAERAAAPAQTVKLLQDDNVHPTSAGYVVMARAAAKALATALQLPADALAAEAAA